ncbi:hypothetical protein S245_015873, partial [Arachis hypogaea]
RLLRRRSAPVTAPATICLAELSSDEIVCSLQRRSPLLQRRFSSGNNLRKRARNFIKLYEICCAVSCGIELYSTAFPSLSSFVEHLGFRFSSLSEEIRESHEIRKEPEQPDQENPTGMPSNWTLLLSLRIALLNALGSIEKEEEYIIRLK